LRRDASKFFIELIEPAQAKALRDVDLSDDEILDLIRSIAIFAWANRLMLNLGAGGLKNGVR
jgi:alkylhydroperoxidase family enzyme